MIEDGIIDRGGWIDVEASILDEHKDERSDEGLSVNLVVDGSVLVEASWWMKTDNLTI